MNSDDKVTGWHFIRADYTNGDDHSACDACPEAESCKKETFNRDEEIAKLIGHLRRDLATLRSTLATTERERDEAQAAAAQMREALELLWGATRPVVLGTINTCGLKDVDTACTCETPCDEIVALKVVPEALESTAGRDFLERYNEAEELLRRSKEITCLPKCDDLNINTQVCDMTGEQCQWCALNNTIDAYLKARRACWNEWAEKEESK